jgi:NADH-quinone oxidoreductase subunit K
MTTAAYLYVGAFLFAAGAFGTIIRTTAAGRLVGIELMLAAATLTFASSSVGFRELDGQVAALVVVVLAVGQATVGFAIVAGSGRAV